MEWARILAYITGTVDQELLLRNEYLAAENRIVKAQLKGRLRLSDAERVFQHRTGTPKRIWSNAVILNRKNERRWGPERR